MGRLLDSIEEKRAVLLTAKEGAERTRKDARKVRCRRRRLCSWLLLVVMLLMLTGVAFNAVAAVVVALLLVGGRTSATSLIFGSNAQALLRRNLQLETPPCS